MWEVWKNGGKEKNKHKKRRIGGEEKEKKRNEKGKIAHQVTMLNVRKKTETKLKTLMIPFNAFHSPLCREKKDVGTEREKKRRGRVRLTATSE